MKGTQPCEGQVITGANTNPALALSLLTGVQTEKTEKKLDI